MNRIKVAYIHSHTKLSVKDGIGDIKEYAMRIKELNEQSEKYEITSLAITEHGNTYKAENNYNVLKEKGIKHIFGLETYHTIFKEDNVQANKDPKYHLVLIATDDVGKKNLRKIDTYGGFNKYVGSFKEYKRTDESIFKECGKGIIASTACLGGLIPKLILSGRYEEAKDKALQYNEWFDQLYLEIQPHELPDQLILNAELVKMSEETGLPLLMAVDAHYANKSDHKFSVLLRELNKFDNTDSESEEDNFTMELKSFEELEEYCIKYNIPMEAITNTQVIADKCTCELKPNDRNAFMPKYPVPVGYTEETFLRKIVHDKFLKQCETKGFKDLNKRLKQLNYELNVICRSGFAGYFLIVGKWIEWCHENKIMTGPGRGSAASSILNYILGVTNCDPVEFNFIFSRFLSETRVELPDIDSDISTEKRSESIQYFIDTYGQDNVSQIITFTKYGLKGIFKKACSYTNDIHREEMLAQGYKANDIRDVISSDEQNKITKLFPEKVSSYEEIEKIALGETEDPDISDRDEKACFDTYNALQDLFEKYPKIYEIINGLKGLVSGVGCHASGVCISGLNMYEHVTMELSKSDAVVLPVISVEMSDIDFYNFLKVDVLGLKTLDVMKYTMEAANLTMNWYYSEDYSDEKVFKFLSEGNTADIFQFMKPTPTRLIRRTKASNILMLFAINTLNRPGNLIPLEVLGNKPMSELYIEGINGNKYSFGLKEVDDLLDDEYGCLIYQEQSIKIGQVIAGYSEGDADSRLRKVLAKGKKQMHKIPEIETEFLYGVMPKKGIYTNKDGKKEEVYVFEKDGDIICDPNYNNLYNMGYNPVPDYDTPSTYNSVGCINNGFKESIHICKKLFAVIRAMALYSFNKSHSGCYSIIGYKEAWLSMYYPLEFIYGCLKVYTDKDKKVDCINNAKKRGIKILPPNVNLSEIKISLVKEGGKNVALIFGISDIKDSGAKACDVIIAERKANGDYKDFYDFIDRLVTNKTEIVQEMILNKETGRANNPVNRSVINALIKGGAFDSLEPNRFKLLNIYNGSINTAPFANAQLDEFYNELRDEKGKIITKQEKWKNYDENMYSRRIKLKYEFDKMELYVSEHPLDLEKIPKIDLKKVRNREDVKFAGIIRKVSERVTRNKKKYTVLTVEINTSAEIDVKLWEESRNRYRSLLKVNNVLIFSGKWNSEYTNVVCDVVQKLIRKDNKEDCNVNTMDITEESVPNDKFFSTVSTPLPQDTSFMDDIG